MSADKTVHRLYTVWLSPVSTTNMFTITDEKDETHPHSFLTLYWIAKHFITFVENIICGLIYVTFFTQVYLSDTSISWELGLNI